MDMHADEEGALFVSDVVLAELVWVLERTYGLQRSEIGRAIRAMASNATLGFESRAVLRDAEQLFLGHKARFADCLILAKARAAGCDSLLSFDRGMRGLPGVEGLSGQPL